MNEFHKYVEQRKRDTILFTDIKRKSMDREVRIVDDKKESGLVQEEGTQKMLVLLLLNLSAGCIGCVQFVKIQPIHL